MFKRIKLLRIKNNIKIEEISKILDISSIEYLKYELGTKTVPINVLSKLAKFYNTSIDYIVEETDSITPNKKNF